MIAEFFRPHDQAARLVAKKSPVQKAIFRGLLPELRARAFTVAGIDSLDQIARVQDAVADYTRGQTEAGEPVTWDTAKKRIVEELAFDDPEAANMRATVLLRTHGFQAYQASNYQAAMEDEDTTHLQYMATEDDRVRDTHLALHRLILPKDDPFWQDHFPPWDWGCRCRVVPLSLRDVKREQAADKARTPEDRRVMQGAQLEALRHGTLIRGPITLPSGRQFRGGSFNVTSPAKTDGPDGFQWRPEDFRMDLGLLREKYRGEPELWTLFEAWARSTKFGRTATVWQWLTRALENKP